MSTTSDQRTEHSCLILMAKSYQEGKPMRTEKSHEFLTLQFDNVSDQGERSNGKITLLNTEGIQGGVGVEVQGAFYHHSF